MGVSVSKRGWTLSVALLLPSCGSGGSTPTPVPSASTPPACSQTLLFQGSAALQSGFAVTQDFSVSSTTDTRLDVLVDWTSAASAIGVYVFQGACSVDQFIARTCTFVVRSEPPAAKPRRVSAPNVAVGNYTLVIANLGAQDEAIAAQIVLSNTTCAPLAFGPAGTAALPWQPAWVSLKSLNRGKR
jgi:hypothetical protein